MLQVRDVVKTYDGRAVVNRVSFDVEAGEIFALLGPNGAGKTTLIRMITDILKPDSGTISLDGHKVTDAGRPEIAYLPEERGLYRRVKVIDVLTYYGRLKGMAGPEAKQQSEKLLDRVGLLEWSQKQVMALSKGMQQKVQLCTALIGDPRLLILDEPFSGLDPINVQLLEDILHERRAAGCTILLSTHQMNKVEEQCDRALMINRGHMVLYGPVGELRTRYSDHAVRVRGTSIPDGAPGVVSIEKQGMDVVMKLETGVTPASVLRALLDRGAQVESFSVETLPLEDLFVKVVHEGLGLDKGQSGPPTMDEILMEAGR
jgi:ABC-2 type transport system ATP-binding protein